MPTAQQAQRSTHHTHAIPQPFHRLKALWIPPAPACKHHPTTHRRERNGAGAVPSTVRSPNLWRGHLPFQVDPAGLPPRRRARFFPVGFRGGGALGGGEDEGQPPPRSRPPHLRRVHGAPRTRDAAGGGAPAVGRRQRQADGEVGSRRRRGSAPPPLLGLGSCSAAMRSGGDGAAGHSGRARGAAGR